MDGRSEILAALVILSGALSVWSERLAFVAAGVEPNKALAAAYLVSYAILFLATIGLATFTVQGWIKGRSSSLEEPSLTPQIWTVLVCLFGLVILVDIRPILWAEISVELPDSKVLPSDRN